MFSFWITVGVSVFFALLKTRAVASADVTTTNTTVSNPNEVDCLDTDAECLPDGSLGVCCMGFCYKRARWESASCHVKNCLANGAECDLSGSLGVCCTLRCVYYEGTPPGLCEERILNNTDGLHHLLSENEGDNDRDLTYSPSSPPAGVDLAPVYGIIALVLLLVLVLGGTTVWVRRQRKGAHKRSLGAESSAGSRSLLGSDALFPATYARLKAVIESKPYKGYEVTEEEFNVDTSALLGKGAFSIVLKAVVRGREVAAKTVPKEGRNTDESTTAAYLEPLLQEFKIRIDVGPHENIVSLVGAHTQRLIYGVCYIFVEICTNGSLLDYISSGQYEFFEGAGELRRDPDSGYTLPPLMGREPDIISGKHFWNWCADISAGMSHLASLGIVHGDLAARNVLLTDTMVGKISDFGLSKKLYDSCKKYVTGNRNVRVPWQHMATESLTRLKFWTPSDVWAFGVTMWELYSLGESPYSPMEWTPEFVSLLTEQGVRLPRPVHATEGDGAYELMMACWALDPDARPAFDEIHAMLSG